MSFRMPEILVAVVLQAVVPFCIAADDGLFSDVRGTTVFQPRDSPEGSPAAPGRRVTKAADLVELLTGAGLEPQVLDDTAVTARKSLTPREFPVLVRITDDERHVAVFLGLASIEDPQKIPPGTLLGLLETSLRYPSVQFGYSRERKRTEVFSVIRNESLTGVIIRDEIARLAIVGRDTAEVWSQESAAQGRTAAARPATPEQTAAGSPAGDQGKTPTPLAPTPPTSPAGSPTTTSLTGKWTAARSATEAFAAEFSPDGQFVLVCVRQGKSVRSSGRFTISGQILSLNDTSGKSLTGTMTALSEAQFSFTPSTGGNPVSPLTFRKAR